LGLAGLCFLGGCSTPAAEAAGDEEPAKVEKVEGQPARITLTEKAVERLGLETAPVSAPRASGPTEVPAAAVLYQSDGTTFVYTNPEPNVYVPAEITVKDIIGDKAQLTAGPSVGTQVVTVAGAELFGAETGLGSGH
jgi:hypothetical protein